MMPPPDRLWLPTDVNSVRLITTHSENNITLPEPLDVDISLSLAIQTTEFIFISRYCSTGRAHAITDQTIIPQLCSTGNYTGTLYQYELMSWVGAGEQKVE